MPVFMMTIVRHGETVYNKKGVLQGQMDTDLSEKGKLQARLVGYRLQHEQFTHIFTSDLNRAAQTCEIILEENKASSTPVTKDPRLRERKFGTFQGRPRIDYVKAAKKAGKTTSEFTPPDAETLAELRDRAIQFFEDLCHMVSHMVESGENNNTAKMASGSGEVFQPGQDDEEKRASTSLDVSDKLCHQSSGSTSSTSGYSSTEADSMERLCPLSPSDFSPVSPGQVFDDSTPIPRGFTPMFDSDIRSQIRGPQTLAHGCPNVSLSPIFEHRLSSISSISSGRNSSFDDTDSVLALTADILIISHGGLLKELLIYFVEDLGAKIADLSCPPNASINKFAVTVGEDDQPKLTCLLNNDKDHLMQQGAEALEKADEIC